MKFVPYLSFDGRCRQAFEFYAKTLGGEIRAMISHRETPASAAVPADWQDAIINAHLVAGEAELMGADAPPGHASKPSGFSVSIEIDDEARAERVFNAFAEGGTIGMPFGPAFWAKRFGMVTDKYGTPWMINCGIIR